MKILVIGSGGREHALAWKLAQSPRVSMVLVAPGNAGTATEAKCRNAEVAANDIDALLALVEREGVSLTVVGPEGPLVAGVVEPQQGAGPPRRPALLDRVVDQVEQAGLHQGVHPHRDRAGHQPQAGFPSCRCNATACSATVAAASSAASTATASSTALVWMLTPPPPPGGAAGRVRRRRRARRRPPVRIPARHGASP